MFQAVTKQVSQVLGNSDLHPNNDVDQSQLLDPLSLSLGKKRTWFWQNATFDITEFNLIDILLSPTEEIKENIKSCIQAPVEVVKDYQYSSNFLASASIGAELAKLFTFKLSGKDVIHLESPLGEITSQRINVKELNDLLKNCRVDLTNQLISQTIANKRRTLSILSDILFINSDATIKLTAGWNITDTVDANLPQVMKNVASANTSGEISKDKTLELGLKAGTRLAYRLHPLEIDPQGNIRVLCLFDGDTSAINSSNGSFAKSAFSDFNPYFTDFNLLPIANPIVRELSLLRELRRENHVADLIDFINNILKENDAKDQLKSLISSLSHIYENEQPTTPVENVNKILQFVNLAELKEWTPVQHKLLLSLLTFLQALVELPSDVVNFITTKFNSLSNQDVRYIFFIFYDLIRGISLEENNDGKVLLNKLSDDAKHLCELLDVQSEVNDEEINKLFHRAIFEPFLLSLFAWRFDVPILF